jgi:hypothetical protein
MPVVYIGMYLLQQIAANSLSKAGLIRSGDVALPILSVRHFASSHGRRRKGLSTLALKANLDHMRASLIIAIQLLAMHAIDALVDIDVPFRMDRLHRALIGAALAR